MKIMNLILGMFLVLTVLICCNQEEPEPGIYWGKVEALKNGELWEAEIFAAPTKYDSVFGVNIATTNFDEHLEFIWVPYQISRYEIDTVKDLYEAKGVFSAFYLLEGGDIFRAIYQPLADPDNYLSITALDMDTREVKGKFQVSYIVYDPKPSGKARDTIRFTNGTFHTRLVDPEDL